MVFSSSEALLESMLGMAKDYVPKILNYSWSFVRQTFNFFIAVIIAVYILLEKERFLESKEKGAPRRVEWSQIGIRRPGFTPPLRSSPVYGRLPRWNRDKLWSYPTFFRRLRVWVLRRGAAAWYSLYRGARLPRRAPGTI